MSKAKKQSTFPRPNEHLYPNTLLTRVVEESGEIYDNDDVFDAFYRELTRYPQAMENVALDWFKLYFPVERKLFDHAKQIREQVPDSLSTTAQKFVHEIEAGDGRPIRRQGHNT